MRLQHLERLVLIPSLEYPVHPIRSLERHPESHQENLRVIYQKYLLCLSHIIVY